MNQRHKDIVKRLQDITAYPEYDYLVTFISTKAVRITIKSTMMGVHYTDDFDLADLLAIVRNVDIEEQCTGHKETLSSLVHLIESAGGAPQLSYAVELGQISWYAKMESALNHAKAILNEEETND